MFGLGAPELLIVLAVILVVFGGSQVPKLAQPWSGPEGVQEGP